MSKNSLRGYYALRWQILERDNFTCQYCGQRAPDAKLEIDHIIPVEEDGKDTEDNLITSCYACNRGKSGLMIRRKRASKRNPAKPYSGIEKVFDTPFRQAEILKIVQDHPEGINAKVISKSANIATNNTRVVLFRLFKKGLVRRIRKGIYSE